MPAGVVTVRWKVGRPPHIRGQEAAVRGSLVLRWSNSLQPIQSTFSRNFDRYIRRQENRVVWFSWRSTSSYGRRRRNVNGKEAVLEFMCYESTMLLCRVNTRDYTQPIILVILFQHMSEQAMCILRVCIVMSPWECALVCLNACGMLFCCYFVSYYTWSSIIDRWSIDRLLAHSKLWIYYFCDVKIVQFPLCTKPFNDSL